MTIDLVITLFVIGFAGSFISGLVGIGGSIIKYPMLLYVPPALGFIAFSFGRSRQNRLRHSGHHCCNLDVPAKKANGRT